MNYKDLIQSLHGAKKLTHTVVLEDGTRLLLLPHGGRVLGVFSSKSEENFYWTHPALESTETATAFYASGAWENSGGDRTWLAPEVDLFFPHYPDVSSSGYFQPRSLDPGSYSVESTNGNLQLVNRFNLRFFRSRSDMDLEIRKWMGPTSDPLAGKANNAAIQFTGYEQHTTLRILKSGAGRVGLWNLVQMPHQGDMLIPTISKATPMLYFGTIDDKDLTIDDRHIRWKMQATGEQKIGVRALQTIGRVGYTYTANEVSNLIIRNFSVNPAAAYIDVPWTDHCDEGYAVQACNVNSKLGAFSELEYHVPAIGAELNSLFCEDVSQVWCYRGNSEAIRSVAFDLLGV